MTDGWYPSAEHEPADDVGPFVAGAPYRGVLHTTESSHFPSYKPGTHPHFTVWRDDRGRVHVTQHVSIRHASAALIHASGQIDTNREGAIQIEIAWYAAQIGDAPSGLLPATRDLMRWIEAETHIARRTVGFKPYPASYGLNNGVRMTVAEWKRFNGWCGHEHVPENDHGDPGAIDMAFLLASPTPPKPPRPAQEDDVARMLEDQRHTPHPVWMADGMERRWIATGAERDFWEAQGVPLVPVSAKDAPHIIDPLPIKAGTKVPS